MYSKLCLFCPTEANAGGTLSYIMNYLSYKTKNDVEIYKPFELESTVIEICNPKKTNIIIGRINKHPNVNINKFNEAGLNNLFVYRHPTLGLRVGSVGRDFVYFVEGRSHSQALWLFDISLVAGKRTFICDLQIVIRLLYAMGGYDLTSEPQTLEVLQNVFILIYRCEIYPYDVCVLFT